MKTATIKKNIHMQASDFAIFSRSKIQRNAIIWFSKGLCHFVNYCVRDWQYLSYQETVLQIEQQLMDKIKYYEIMVYPQLASLIIVRSDSAWGYLWMHRYAVPSCLRRTLWSNEIVCIPLFYLYE